MGGGNVTCEVYDICTRHVGLVVKGSVPYALLATYDWVEASLSLI